MFNRITRGGLPGATIAAVLLAIACGKAREAGDMEPSAMAGAPSTSGGSADATGGSAGSTVGSRGESGSSGRVGQAGGTVTWDPHACHAKPVPEPSEPTAAAAWTVARKYCTALATQQGCFKPQGAWAIAGCSDDEALEACVAQVLWFHSRGVPTACEDAWRADFECGAASTVVSVPPCADVNLLGNYASNVACARENAALSACLDSNGGGDVQVTGSYTSCSFPAADASAASCVVSCQLGPYLATLNCSGPDGLPKQCGCAINGHVSTTPDPIFVNDCTDAAAQAADGLCTSRFDCCFSYLDRDKEVCHCGDPRDFGYDSCDAMIAVANGERVDLCPALLPEQSGDGCWPPGHCLP